MSPELMSMYAMLLGLLGPAPVRRAQRQHAPRADSQAGQPDRRHRRLDHPGGRLLEGCRRRARHGDTPSSSCRRFTTWGSAGRRPRISCAISRRTWSTRKPAVVTISVGINDVWHRAANPHDPARARPVLDQRLQDGRDGTKGGHQGDPAHTHRDRRERRGRARTSDCGSTSRPKSRSRGKGNARWSICMRAVS